MSALDGDWVLVDEPPGMKTYVDTAAIHRHGNLAAIRVRFSMERPGMNNAADVAFHEMILMTEFDLAQKTTRAYGSVVVNVDGTETNARLHDEWKPVTGRMNAILEFLLA